MPSADPVSLLRNTSGIQLLPATPPTHYPQDPATTIFCLDYSSSLLTGFPASTFVSIIFLNTVAILLLLNLNRILSPRCLQHLHIFLGAETKSFAVVYKASHNPFSLLPISSLTSGAIPLSFADATPDTPASLPSTHWTQGLYTGHSRQTERSPPDPHQARCFSLCSPLALSVSLPTHLISDCNPLTLCFLACFSPEQ